MGLLSVRCVSLVALVALVISSNAVALVSLDAVPLAEDVPAALALPRDDPERSAAAPAAVSLSGYGNGMPRAESLAPTAENPVVVLTDAEGDTSLFGFDVLGAGIPVPVAEDAHVDIVSLTVLETPEALLFQLRHRGYPAPTPTPAAPFISFGGYGCTLYFEHAGAEERYRLSLQSMGSEPERFYQMRGQVYLEGEWLANIPAALVAGERMELLLPKHLVGYGTPTSGLALGAVLESFSVYCGGNSGLLFLNMGDTAEPAGDDADRYAPQLSNMGHELRATFRGHDRVFSYSSITAPRDEHYTRNALGVPPGEARAARIDLQATPALKQANITMAASLVDLHGAAVSDWTVTAPARVTLAAGEKTSVPILIAVPDSAAHGETNHLLVTFTAGDATVHLMRPVVSSLDPAPERQVVHFHGNRFDGLFMNTLPTDARYASEPVASLGFADIHMSLFLRAEMDTGFTTARTLTTIDPVTATIMLSAGEPMERELRVEVAVDGDAIGERTKRVSLTTTPTPFDVMVDPDIAGYPIGEGQRLRVNVTVMATEFPYFLPLDSHAEIRWHLDGSSLAIPFRSTLMPAERDGIVLRLLEPTSQFLAAAERSQAIDLEVENKGADAADVALSLGSGADGWGARFLPTDSLRLAAGETRRVCLELAAPTGLAREVTTIVVQAGHAQEPDTGARLPVTFHAGRGAMIDESVCSMTGTRTQSGPGASLEGSPREAPALPLVLGLLAALGVASLIRRRAV